MYSGLKYVCSKNLKSTNFIPTKTFATLTTTIFEATENKPFSFKTIKILRRNFYKLYSFESINWIGKYQLKQPTVVKNFSSSKEIKSENLLKSFNYFHKYQKIMDAPPGVFKGVLDRFNGVTIESSKEFNTEDNFAEKLKKSLDYWQEQKRRAIWFHVKTEHSEWVPHLTKQNFEFHHAKNGLVVLNRWLPDNEYPNLPAYAHTMLGVGGLVVNDKNEILVVSERYSLIPKSWKLPGGYAEPHENIVDAAIREVREETGIETVFNTVISIRHSHGGIFGCSDIYCVVALTPKTSELHRCEREIAQAKWMPCEEYLQHPNVHETNRHFLRCFFDYKKCGIRFTCEMAQHQILKKDYCLYYMKPLEDKKIVNEKLDKL